MVNPGPSDTKANYVANQNNRPLGVDPRWPFYGQPLDVHITIYGAVSENVPASVGDTSAWMEKWGWIPSTHGSSPFDVDKTIGYRSPLEPAEAKTVRMCRSEG